MMAPRPSKIWKTPISINIAAAKVMPAIAQPETPGASVSYVVIVVLLPLQSRVAAQVPAAVANPSLSAGERRGAGARRLPHVPRASLSETAPRVRRVELAPEGAAPRGRDDHARVLRGRARLVADHVPTPVVDESLTCR